MTETIYLNGVDVQATTNLVAALRRLRCQGHNVIWVDALCINQNDREERALQVRRMKDIFSKAKRVLVWLGVEDENSSKALDFIEQFSLASPNHESSVQKPEENDTANKSEGLIACKIFLARPYWRRVWILQEIAVAAEIQVYCGARTVSWASIHKALSMLSSARIPKFEAFRAAFRKRRFDTLLQVLYATRYSLATDERDKLYALLSLTSNGENVINFPNYKQSIGTVLKEMTKSLLLSGVSLDIITFRRPDRVEHADVPSWIPDWTELATVVRPWQLRILLRSENFARLLGHLIKFKIFNDILSVSGNLMGKIKSLTTSISGGFPDDPLIELNREELARTPQPWEFDPYGKGLDDRPSFIKSLLVLRNAKTGDLLRERYPDLLQWFDENKDFAIKGQALEKYLAPSRTAATMKSVLGFASGMLEPSIGRLGMAARQIEDILKYGTWLFVMEDGTVGLVHARAQVGDDICLFNNSRTPIALRRCEGGWTVIGEAYVFLSEAKLQSVCNNGRRCRFELI